MYNAFDCHFKQNQKNQSDMVDPVVRETHCAKQIAYAGIQIPKLSLTYYSFGGYVQELRDLRSED